jgi:uncharacterized delta-60 repeat protein
MRFLRARKSRGAPPERSRRGRYRARLEVLEDRALLSGPGALDLTFGSGGLVTTAIGPNNAFSEAVVVQSDGKIVAGGGGWDASGNEDFTLARYNPNGSLDTTFGKNGVVQTVINKTGRDYITGLALQSDGKIVAVGHAVVKMMSLISDSAFAVVRYNTNGNLDTTFGGGKSPTGIVLTNLGPSQDAPSAVAIQDDGKIVVAGTGQPSGGNQEFAVVRYNTNGTPDTTFGPGQNGIVLTPLGAKASQANGLALQGDGKIVVAGDYNSAMAVVRYTTSGQLDGSFGTGGIVSNVLPAGTTQSEGDSVSVLSNGLIVVGGASGTVTPTVVNNLTLARFTASGQLDTTFGNSGFAFNNTIESARALGLGANGDLLAAGTAWVLLNNVKVGDFGVAAFLPGGASDTTFGTNGTTTADFSGGNDQARAMTIQGDGNIVVGGSTITPAAGNFDQFALARFLGPGTSSAVTSSAAVTVATRSAPSPGVRPGMMLGAVIDLELVDYVLAGGQSGDVGLLAFARHPSRKESMTKPIA